MVPPMQTTKDERPHYRAYTLHNFKHIPQIQALSEEDRFAIEVVGQVLPFKSNTYMVNELIRWDEAPDDPLFILNFPRREMLKEEHFDQVAALLRRGAPLAEVRATADRIRMELNPHPAGQMEHNVPRLEGEPVHGMQHKYYETVLFFPSQGQTCHAYCTFCFRWPQFVGIEGLRFASREVEKLTAYLSQHPYVTDVLFTGGDPLVMRADMLAAYLDPLLRLDHTDFQNIRIGTKAISYWPYRFLTDPDADELLGLFSRITRAGKHLAFMAHFNHPREMETEAAQDAIARIRATGAQIRTQAPILAHINDVPHLWEQMWRTQVRLGCFPYYMFVVRDTGAQHYFGVPLVRTWEIFREAYQSISGITRTVRGPVMSAHPGKCQLLGVNEVNGEPVLTLQFLQGRNPDWVLRPFFAEYNEEALWLTDLRPAFDEPHFFFDAEAEKETEVEAAWL